MLPVGMVRNVLGVVRLSNTVGNYHRFLHDITGVGQSVNDNGLFPVRRNFDLATGIGTPRMGALITARRI